MLENDYSDEKLKAQLESVKIKYIQQRKQVESALTQNRLV